MPGWAALRDWNTEVLVNQRFHRVFEDNMLRYIFRKFNTGRGDSLPVRALPEADRFGWWHWVNLG